MVRGFVFVLLTTLVWLGWSGTLEAREPAARVIMVLDASGSMWGQIQGKTKIEIARAAIAELLANWNPSIDLGLIAYGHRKKGELACPQGLYHVLS